MPAKSTRRIEMRPLRSLKADPRNPKAHDGEVIDGSITDYGFIESIVVDDRTGLTVSGHGRTEALSAMRDRGEEPPDGVIVSKDDWLVPVTVGWASEDDLKAAGALIALNRAGEVGGWVDESLLALLDSLGETDVTTGFDTADIEALRARLATIEPVSPDEFPAYGDDIATHYACPSCGYEWSGSPVAGLLGKDEEGEDGEDAESA